MQSTQGTYSQSVTLSICKTLFICRIILPSFAKRLTQWVFTLINLAPVRSYPWSSLENAHGSLRAQRQKWDRSREDREGRGVCMDTVKKKKKNSRGPQSVTTEGAPSILFNRDHFLGAVPFLLFVRVHIHCQSSWLTLSKFVSLPPPNIYLWLQHQCSLGIYGRVGRTKGGKDMHAPLNREILCLLVSLKL